MITETVAAASWLDFDFVLCSASDEFADFLCRFRVCYCFGSDVVVEIVSVDVKEVEEEVWVGYSAAIAGDGRLEAGFEGGLGGG